jgi:PAS domain S-box-containing protein
MEELAHLQGRRSESNPKPRPLLGSRAATGPHGTQAQGLNRGLVAIALGLICIGVLGGVNLGCGTALNFEFFYLLLCAAVGWIGGARGAALCALESGIFLCFVERAGGNTWIFFWNSVVRLLAFLAIGWLAAETGKLTRNLEQTVWQRTTRLQSEVEGHKETAELLRETMQLFKQVTENVAHVFWVTDPARGHFEYISPEFEKVWASSCQTLYVSPGVWLEGVHPEDRERVTRAALASQANGQYDEEYRVVRPDGSLRWVHDRAFPVKNAAGVVYRIVGIAEDITERKRTERLLQAQRDMGIALGSTSDLDSALQRLVEIAVQLEGIDGGGVYLIDSKTGELHLEAHRGFAGAFLKGAARYKADTAEARLAKSGRVLYLRQEQIPGALERLWSGKGLRALAVVPLQHKGLALGMLTLVSCQQDEILPRTRVAIEMIASQVAGAIVRIRAEESLRGLQRQILEISDREQARIGQDIHDGLCQLLIGMGLSANSLEQALVAQKHLEAPTARKMCMLLDEAITESRHVCRGLYPIRLSTHGLAPALEELAGTLSERHKIECHCEVPGEGIECNMSTATHLYRIAQEALNNALKHSGARHVWIRLAGSDGGIILAIKDDGKGLDDAAPRASGMGLHIMEYRARLIGGSLRIESDSHGTVVLCSAPGPATPEGALSTTT